MKKIETAMGKMFSVLWCGESSIDGQLRFCIQGSTIVDAFDTFSKPIETGNMKYYVNDTKVGEFREIDGFTVFKGINQDSNGVVVALAKGE